MPELRRKLIAPPPPFLFLPMSGGSPPGNEPPGQIAIPPRIDPSQWEHFVAFRETFLLHFTEPRHNRALRGVGDLIYELALDYNHFPDQPEGWRRAELRAAVADLRHLEGYLVTAASDPPDEPYEAALCRTAVLMSQEVGSVAEHIE
ncbi:MAG TPA: hypothetical protein VLX28_07310, partial [Thermoanaerobaculia bacterium]|nr:hypothetical protein [Thermoanaerobaculia bacterium]